MSSTTTLFAAVMLTSLLAQAGAFGAPAIGNLTATAILGWYAWHTASKTIPGLVRDFREELAAERDEFRKEREAVRREMADERTVRHNDHQAMVEALWQLTERIVLAVDKSNKTK